MKLLKKGLPGIAICLGLSSPLSTQKTVLKLRTEGPRGELTVTFTEVKDILHLRNEVRDSRI